jgi:hypothetical protein
MSGSVKTSDGTVDDPVLRDELVRFDGRASRRTYSFTFQPSRFKRRNASETMSYFTPIAIMILVLSPVLVPLVITGVHAIRNWRLTPEPTSSRDHRAPVRA